MKRESCETFRLNVPVDPPAHVSRHPDEVRRAARRVEEDPRARERRARARSASSSLQAISAPPQEDRPRARVERRAARVEGVGPVQDGVNWNQRSAVSEGRRAGRVHAAVRSRSRSRTGRSSRVRPASALAQPSFGGGGGGVGHDGGAESNRTSSIFAWLATALSKPFQQHDAQVLAAGERGEASRRGPAARSARPRTRGT